MFAKAKITSKGQITVPIEIREALGVGKGDMLVFETQAQYITVKRAPTLQEIIDEVARASSSVPLSDKSDDELAAEVAAAHYEEKMQRSGGPFLVRPGETLILKDGVLVPYEPETDEETS
ncbi:MAG: AbrB/MazE/SpoVT family DNA-binding domain-containing protein [Coriobacteriia bacterium]